MNIMRKVMGVHHRGATDGPQSVQDNNLGLMHLRKLFSEFRSPPPGASQQDLKDKLYNMLPLFNKVFGAAPSSDMMEKFPDILQFCGHVSRLMVSEIRKRASDQSTESASSAIVKFLEIDSTEETSSGWMLLSTVNLLSSGQSSLIDCMTAACLPSTLVKCLYLFFDLPDMTCADLLEPGCEFTARERRVLLQKVFVQVLVRLCSHVSPAEELARKDDLGLLFSAITSWCPQHNVPWRKSAAEVLMTLSRHGLTPNVVQYIHSKGCVALCIENMQRVQELSPIELVEMFVTVFCFLKDSSDVSQMLLDDFRTCQGYLFLTDFLLKMEKNQTEEAIQALRNLVLLVGSLTTCGFIELKPSTASSGSLFQIPGFSIPQPTGKGVSVRNIQAFQVLQTVFLKGSSVNLCSTILDVISSVYHQDSANYFILEPQNTLPQFAEKIHLKTLEIQVKFFEMVEFLVFNLNFVPCKELISLSILIKTNHSLESSILCIKTLLKILNHHSLYKDVFREVGLLEVMVTCLHRYAALLKEVQNDIIGTVTMISEQEQDIGFLVMDALSLLLNNNNANASVFRECGGARCAHNMVPYLACRQQALNTVQQLILSNGGEDDMGTLLALMHTASTTALELKTHVLKSLLHVLRESHRTRTVFRKVGGFVYVMSVLVSMEGCLSDPPKAPWHTAERGDVITLLKTVFSTLTVAMRYEPANARVFSTEVRYASLTEAVRLLGCFSCNSHMEKVPSNLQAREEDTEFTDLFTNIHNKDYKCPGHIPQPLVSACLMLRYLYDMSLDNFDRPPTAPAITENCPPNMKRISSVLESASDIKDIIPISMVQKRASTGCLSLNLNQPASQSEPLLVHAGAVISMLHLVPAIQSDKSPQLALDLQRHTCDVIRMLMRTERNQQVMCEAGLPHELLTYCSLSLTDERHDLHPPLQYMFERLAAQCLTPKDLRDFLRLGSPLCCTMEDEELYDARRSHDLTITGPTYATDKPNALVNGIRKSQNDISNKLKTNGGAVPLTRVKCLVSMTTPRDVRLHGASITPAFVEFDMSAEGFGCLYLPSIAPQGPPNPAVMGAGMITGNDPGVIGGIGTGERLFPPQSGLTFSSWLCIDKFSVPQSDPHPVRLLTVVRNIQGREENLICLNVFLVPRDRALFVSTKERHLPLSAEHSHHEPAQSDTTVRFWCPELTQEGQWRHLVLIFHKAGILKNSSVSLFIDGSHINTQKLHYISPNLGGTGTASPNAATTIFSYIGTPPQVRRPSRLLWRQGPCHLFEDIVSTGTVQTLYQLGPNYIGSFQAPLISESSESSAVIIPEDKIMFGIHAHAMSLMTVARIRKVYNKTDAKTIAKQLGMSAHENATPIRILHNSSQHLSGSARSFGAILMGYLGVRTFCPKPVAKMIMNVGGTSALLGLIAMATDVEGLYAAVKALVCVVRSNQDASREMDRTKGYQTLAVLFKKKRHLLNSHILHLTFSLVGTLDSGRETTIIPNKTAFEDLLCDLEVWKEAPFDLQRSLYEHFYELLTESSDQKNILHLMQEMCLVSKLLYILRDSGLTRLTTQTVMSVLSVLLCGASHGPSLLRFGQFMASLLPAVGSNEKLIVIESPPEFIGGKRPTPTEGDLFDSSGSNAVYNIKLRNLCLEMLLKLLTMSPTTYGVNTLFSEELQKTLGYDWLLLFMRGGVHSSTVMTALQIVVQMLRNPNNMARFREGSHGGGWLTNTESVLKNRIGVLLGFNVGSGSQKIPNREVNTDISHLPGFTHLQWLMPQHADTPQIYLLLMSLLLGQSIKQVPKSVQFDLDTIWTVIYGIQASRPTTNKNNKIELCGEAAVVLLSMVRTVLNQPWEQEPETSWILEYPVTPMQFILYLYHNQSDFVPLCMTSEFITALAATLFPYRTPSEANSEITTPIDDFKPYPGSDPIVLVKSEPKNNTNVATLSSHPAKKFVMDFLRMIIVDSLSLSQSSKSAPVIDLILEVSPEHSTQTQRRGFQTEVLNNLMDHLLAADVLLGDQAALPIVTGGSYTHMANNVFYLAGRVVDKLWQGAYVRDPKEVFDFISKLISQAKRKSSGVSLDSIYKCLNRTILYQLSRPMITMADHANILDALHKLMENRNLIFGPGNFDQEFLGCLCYCLLQLTDDPRNISDPPALRTTTWHIDNSECYPDMISDSVHSPEGLQLLSAAAKRVWDELYFCKKPAIEEIFKVTLTSSDSGTSTKYDVPDLQTVRPLIQEAAAKIWLTYFENERKCVYSTTERIQHQLQTKLQKVSHGVLRFAQRKQKKDVPAVKALLLSSQECLAWTTTHIDIVRDLVEFQYKQYQESQYHVENYLLEEWGAVERELMRERGLWGPPVGSELDKWQLDLTEGPHRMRKKMVLNDMFYVHYPFRPPNDDSKPLKYKMAISHDSQKYYERYRSRSLVAEEEILSDDINDNTIQPNLDQGEYQFEDLATNTPTLLPKLSKAKVSQSTDNDEDNDLDASIATEAAGEGENQGEGQVDGQTEADNKTDNQTILKLLEEGEKISHMFRCARIQGLDTMEGLLLFGKEHFYIVDGFTLLRTKEIADIDNLPPDMHDPIIPKTAKGSAMKKTCSKFGYEDIREVHKRRYLLQPIAVEVFSSDGRNLLLACPRKVRNKVYARFMTLATAITDSAHESVSGQKQNAKVEPGTGLISSLIGEKSVTQRWERGEISNFEYLMCLNTLAGRSYNDLMQYPVFPWIVADYQSEELDLTDPATFRDLSMPMGAQTPNRLKQFKKRYTDWDDPQGETPPYHYGTHYSSAMIVASYLVRMEPFAQIFLRLQGGHFDLADRMFHSVGDGWLSASKHNMADVKELIPEFFYLPEFLRNDNNFDLGAKQSGVPLGEVVLPTWAKGDPREFIRAHREALECDYVSMHLNEWIDLIFGYKQQGPAAVESINVFHHLFYEGNVDIYNIDDPLKKNATIGFINNFGQIPKQLFKKPHPQKKLNMPRPLESLPLGSIFSSQSDKLFFHHLDNLRPTMTPVKELKSAVGQIMHIEKAIMAVEQNKVLIPPHFNKYLAWGFADLSLRIGNYDSEKATSVFENMGSGEILCAACPDAKTLITAGTSTVVNVWEFGKGKDRRHLTLKRPLYGHTEAVTCISASAGYNVIVTGSRDRTCIVWDLSRLVFVRQLRGHAAPVASICINELGGDIATCAGTYLHLWSINGDEIASINTATGANQQILCVAMSQMTEWDNRNVIMTGNSDGVVRMWSVEFVQVADDLRTRLHQEQSIDSTSSVSSSTQPQAVPGGRKRSIIPDEPLEERSAAERLKDFKDPEKLASKSEDLGSSVESDSGNALEEMKRGVDALKSESTQSNLVNNSDRVSHNGDMYNNSNSAVQDSTVTNPAGDKSNNTDAKSSQIEPKSPGSDFEIVTETDVKDALSSALERNRAPPRRQMLREGFVWQRQLVFRSKLTMHTAFERKDNKDPAAVTSVAVSKDHKTVYVGDAKGRVYSWTVTDQPGRVVADHWVKDEGGENCVGCNVRFSFSERRHHCRNCGQLFCSKCSRFETEIRRLRILKPVRVCQTCYNSLKAMQAADALHKSISAKS